MDTALLELLKDAPYAAILAWFAWMATTIILAAMQHQKEIWLATLEKIPDGGNEPDQKLDR